MLAASRCGDPAGDPSTEGVADVDLVAVDLERAADGLRVRFRLSGDVSADAGTVAGAPATNVWQVLMAAGDDVLYAFTVTQRGTAWESALIDFAAASGDRLDSIDAPTGSTVDVVIPATDLGRLPQTFTWWALTNTDRRTPVGPYIGDDCPNGTGDVDATAMVPGEATRSTLSG